MYCVDERVVHGTILRLQVTDCSNGRGPTAQTFGLRSVLIGFSCSGRVDLILFHIFRHDMHAQCSILHLWSVLRDEVLEHIFARNPRLIWHKTQSMWAHAPWSVYEHRTGDNYRAGMIILDFSVPSFLVPYHRQFKIYRVDFCVNAYMCIPELIVHSI